VGALKTAFGSNGTGLGSTGPQAEQRCEVNADGTFPHGLSPGVEGHRRQRLLEPGLPAFRQDCLVSDPNWQPEPSEDTGRDCPGPRRLGPPGHVLGLVVVSSSHDQGVGGTQWWAVFWQKSCRRRRTHQARQIGEVRQGLLRRKSRWPQRAVCVAAAARGARLTLA